MKTRKLWAWILVAALLLPLIPMTHAETSDEIWSEIENLKEEQANNQDRLNELNAEINANWNSIEEMVEYKNNIDEQIFLLYSEIENLDQQIAIYTDLIAETQAQLDEAQKDLDQLNEKYKDRVRAMEESGELSYWSVIFKANSFTDLIDRLNLIQEITEIDQRMMDQLRQAAATVEQTKTDLEKEKAGLEESRGNQAEAQKSLEAKRAEADEILAKLNENRQDLESEHSHCSDESNALLDQIAQAEKEYYEALQAEEEERRRQEEEERRRQEEEERRNQATESTEEPTEATEAPTEAPQPGETEAPTEATQPEETEAPTEPEETEPPATEPEETEPEPTTPSGAKWIVPCSYIYISSRYGYRASGWHNGVDFAAPRGTPIYAARSGTVTTVQSLTYSYGNYVVVNHGDGYSSLYAHMDYYVVSAGEYVNQGQLIGYVGSTGNSSGNHLHLTIFYMGSTVNPMDYLP